MCALGLHYAEAGVASGGGSGQNSLSSGAGPRGQPYFDAVAPRNVTALVGKSAYLTCKVKNLGNKTVRLTKNILFYISLYKLKCR